MSLLIGSIIFIIFSIILLVKFNLPKNELENLQNECLIESEYTNELNQKLEKLRKNG